MSRARTHRSAFTLTELLVVISIIVLLIALAIPAFTSILYNNERAQAENQLRVGLAAARDMAIQSDGGDAAAVFRFSAPGRIVITAAIQVASIDDEVISNGTYVQGQGGQPGRVRDVFVQVPGVEPIQLPRGWSVRGFAPPGTVDAQRPSGAGYGWYDGPSMPSGTQTRGNWVFPETAFTAGTADQGWNRQTFIVRFEAGTGSLAAGNADECIIVDQSPAQAFRTVPPFSNYRLDRDSDPGRFIRRTLSPASPLTVDERRALLGDRSPDTILARPVTELALYDEARLAASLQSMGLNKATGTVYGDPASPRTVPTSPMFDSNLFPGGFDAAQVNQNISLWLEGRLAANGVVVESDARIFTLQRYLGQMQEVTP